MESDIKLDGHVVIIEATDVILDAPERRTSPDGLRRALVHGQNDQLVLNYNGDYPAGVSINGPIHVSGLDPLAPGSSDGGRFENVEIDRDRVDDLNLGRLEEGRPQIDVSIRPPLDIQALFTNVKAPVDLVDEIRRLRRAILALDGRVKALEAKG
jgi:hypothetical protein